MTMPSSPRSLRLYAIAATQFSVDTVKLDESAMTENAARLVDAGIRDLLLTGAYGEFQALTNDERVAVVRAVRNCSGVQSVMACAALPSTHATIDLAQRMFDAGADMVMVSAPLVAELTEREMLRHFECINDSVGSGELVIYNNPIFGVDLSPSQLAEVSRLPQMRAIKQGTQRLGWFARSVGAVRTASAGQVAVYAASDLVAHLTLMAGADGLTSTNCWVFPAAYLALLKAAEFGDAAKMMAVAEALEPYADLTRQCGQPRTVKAALELRGYAGSRSPRLPYVPLDSQECAALSDVLAECDRRLAAQVDGGS